MLRVLKAANVSYSTWTRWKRGAIPGLTTYLAVQSTLDRMIAELEARESIQ
jgi:hypothetical protein